MAHMQDDITHVLSPLLTKGLQKYFRKWIKNVVKSTRSLLGLWALRCRGSSLEREDKGFTTAAVLPQIECLKFDLLKNKARWHSPETDNGTDISIRSQANGRGSSGGKHPIYNSDFLCLPNPWPWQIHKIYASWAMRSLVAFVYIKLINILFNILKT